MIRLENVFFSQKVYFTEVYLSLRVLSRELIPFNTFLGTSCKLLTQSRHCNSRKIVPHATENYVRCDKQSSIIHASLCVRCFELVNIVGFRVD